MLGAGAVSSAVLAFTLPSVVALTEGDEAAAPVDLPDLGQVEEPEAEGEGASAGEGTSSGEGASKGKRRKRRRRRKLPNPGGYDEASKESQEALSAGAGAFAGGKFELVYTPVQAQNKVMSFQFAASMDPAQYQGGKELVYAVSLQNEQGLMMARLDNNGALYGRAQQQLTDNITGAFTTNILDQQEVVIMELDYKGSDFNSKAKYMSNPDGHHLTGQYNQSVTQKTSLGVELTHLLGATTILNFSGRWAQLRNKKKEGDFVTGTLSTQGLLTGSYARKLCENVVLSSSLTIAPSPQGPFPLNSTVSLGALYRYNSFRYNGLIKSNGECSATLDSMLAPAVVLSFSGVLNHFTGDSKFGTGLRIGG